MLYTWYNEINDVESKLLKADETKVTLSDLSPGTDYNVTIEAVGQPRRRSPSSEPISENTSKLYSYFTGRGHSNYSVRTFINFA